MVQVEGQALGFGGGASVDLNEVLLVVKLVFIGLVVYNCFLAPPPDKNVFEILSGYVLGYPVCEGVFCALPSEVSLSSVVSVFLGTFQTGNGVDAYVGLVLGLFDTLKGMIGIYAVVTGLAWALRNYFGWLFYWHNLAGQHVSN